MNSGLCPECFEVLKEPDRCSECGWSAAGTTARKVHQLVDHDEEPEEKPVYAAIRAAVGRRTHDES